MNRFWLLIMGPWLAAGSAQAAPGDEHAFELTWRKDGFSKTINFELDRTEPFAAEPDFGGREVLRGIFEIGPRGQREKVGLAWDYREGKAYVDLNRDGDLTNDPDGVVETEDGRRGDYVYQNFTEFPLELSTDHGSFPYRVALRLSKSSSYHFAYATLRSGYGGEVELYGTRWEFRVSDTFRGQVVRGDKFSIVPVQAETGGVPVNGADGLDLPNRLFLDGRCYEMTYAFEGSRDGTPVMRSVLREQEVPMAHLRIEGQRIDRLVFGDDDLLVVPQLTDAVQEVPAGDYQCKSLRLRTSDRLFVSPEDLSQISVRLEPDKEVVFRGGCPLKSEVTAARSGGLLTLDYKLTGQGGETYNAREVTRYDEAKKPAVSICKGDLLLASGQFEYG